MLALERSLLRGFLSPAEALAWKQGEVAAAESGLLLQLIFDGRYEAIFSNSAIQNIFNVPSVTEENIDSYLEKQILAYLDCPAEADNMERQH